MDNLDVYDATTPWEALQGANTAPGAELIELQTGLTDSINLQTSLRQLQVTDNVLNSGSAMRVNAGASIDTTNLDQ